MIEDNVKIYKDDNLFFIEFRHYSITIRSIVTVFTWAVSAQTLLIYLYFLRLFSNFFFPIYNFLLVMYVFLISFSISILNAYLFILGLFLMLKIFIFIFRAISPYFLVVCSTVGVMYN